MNMNILVVDDNRDNRYLLETLLKGNGYVVVSVGNGGEALSVLRKEDIHLIISDILMPLMDGFQLCRECKKDERLANIPFVFYSATYTDPKDVEFGLSLGASRFIIKPQEPDIFIGIIREVLIKAVAGKIPVPQKPPEEEAVYFKKYNEALIRKLESKMLRLEREIGERMKVEEALKNQHSILNGIIESADALIFSVDKEYRYTSFNKSHAAVMKAIYGKDIQLGKSLLEYMSVEEDRDKAKHNIDRTFCGEKVVEESYSGEEALSRLYFIISHSPIRNEDGEVTGVVVLARDITKRKRAEEALRQANLELEFITDLMSHDLTNINQAILGYLELLGETELTEIQRKYFSITMYSARRNAKLIDNVKKIQKSRFCPLSPTDLNACIEEAIKGTLPPPKKKVKINYDPRPCLVLGNELLRDVVSNLLDNAIKFDPLEEVIVDIAVSDEGAMCRLSVTDRGSGIPDEYKKSIFSRWERLEKGVRWSGLGLHLVKTIVEGCGGEVQVEDNSPKGSIFSILLRKVG